MTRSDDHLIIHHIDADTRGAGGYRHPQARRIDHNIASGGCGQAGRYPVLL